MLGSWVGAQGFRPANPKLAGPSVARKHLSPHREGCARWLPQKPRPPSRTPSCLALYSPAACEEPGTSTRSNAGQVVPRAWVVPEHGCASGSRRPSRSRCPNWDRRSSCAAHGCSGGAVANGPALALNQGRKGGHCVRVVAEVGCDLGHAVGQGDKPMYRSAAARVAVQMIFFFCDSDVVGENFENSCGRGTREVPVFGTVPGVFLRIPHPKPLARSSGRRPGFSCDASSHSSSFSRWFVALVQVVKPLYKLLAAALIQLADLRDHLLDPLLILIMS